MDTSTNEKSIVTLADYNNGSTYDRDTHVLYVNEMAELNIKEKQMKFDGIEAIYREIDIHKPTFLRVIHPEGALKLQFEVEGHSEFVPKINTPSSIEVLIPGSHYNGIYMPYIRGQLYYPRSRKCLDVMMTLDYLRGLLGQQEGIMVYFISGVSSRSPCLLHERAQGITAAMLRCINEIIRSTVSERLQSVYIQNKLAELILLVADDVSRKSERQLTRLSSNLDDTSTIARLKEWIDQHVTSRLPYLNCQLGRASVRPS